MIISLQNKFYLIGERKNEIANSDKIKLLNKGFCVGQICIVFEQHCLRINLLHLNDLITLFRT